MWKHASIVITAIALLRGAEPRWLAPGTCITPTRTLCRTFIYESSGWANRSWGFHAIDRYQDRLTEAVRSDGTAMLRVSHRSFKFLVVPSVSYDRTRVIFPAKHQTFEFEHSLKEVREMGGLWRFAEYWSDEPDCSDRAALAGEIGRIDHALSSRSEGSRRRLIVRRFSLALRAHLRPRLLRQSPLI
jgi:hypothetical protein